MKELEKPTPNRKYKDSIFVDLLTSDEKNIRNVCKALDNSITTEPIEILKLDNVLYTGLKNDVSCLVGNKLILLIEHQSSINENMPIRCLQYIGRLYENLIPLRDRYSAKRKYPKPGFYVFYNGDAPYPQYKELCLSDSFIDKTRGVSLELIVKVININYSLNNEFLKKCGILNEYSQFVNQVSSVFGNTY